MPSSTASSIPRTASPSTERPCANHRKNPASEHEQLFFELLVGARFAPGLVCAARGPRRDRACRRARGRQGRCAPLTRWPEDGPSLTAAVRDGPGCVQVGAEGWCRSNKRMERESVSTWWTSHFRFQSELTLGTIFEAIYPIFWSRFLLIPDSCPSSKMPNNRSTPVVNKEIRDGQAEFYTRNMMREAQ